MSFGDDLEDALGTTCDKCGRPVQPSNDMALVMAATGIPGCEWIPTLWRSRHFLPLVDEAGVVVCEGSPSRAQYLEGQPRDTRGYPYFAELEPIYRAAWARLQAHASGKSVV